MPEEEVQCISHVDHHEEFGVREDVVAVNVEEAGNELKRFVVETMEGLSLIAGGGNGFTRKILDIIQSTQFGTGELEKNAKFYVIAK